MEQNMEFTTGAELLARCRESGKPISAVMLERELQKFGGTKYSVRKQMKESLDVMRQSVTRAQTEKLNLLGGYIGGESRALSERIAKKGAMAGMISRAAAYAMGVIELNASMGCIVAAPTAGSSGVIPGVLIAADDEYHFGDDALTAALFHAGAIGYLIDRNATLSGAEGGCQAEVGAASAMAASALCELLGGTPEMCLCAAGDAIANILGLVCDPIGGLVESPCQKRNAMGVANAIISAEIALATGGKMLVPFDEVVAAMFSVGRSIPYQLRETALGGLATAPSVKKARDACESCGGCR